MILGCKVAGSRFVEALSTSLCLDFDCRTRAGSSRRPRCADSLLYHVMPHVVFHQLMCYTILCCDLASTCVHVYTACSCLTLLSSAAVIPQDRRPEYGQEKSCGRRQGVLRNQPFPLDHYDARHPCGTTPHCIALLRLSVLPD